jgi:hypothetical protein
MDRLILAPGAARAVGTATSVLVGIAIFVFGAPPLILVPTILLVGTVFFELRLRTMHRLGRR